MFFTASPIMMQVQVLALLTLLVAGPPVSAIAIPLTSASSGHVAGYGGSYSSHNGYGSSPYKIGKSYNPYSAALTSSGMHSPIPYSSPYTSPYSSGYTSPYSYSSMSGMGSYFDQMPAYETAIDVHGSGFY